ncbi:MAG: SGNH/GDSL hydrolase family protein [Acidobacteriota bacterium]
MTTKLLRAKTLALVFAGAAAAAPPLSAQTTFHKYVALGDSLTAGVQGACLVGRNQQTAYPKLVANSLGITDFELPLVGESATVTSPASACLGARISGTSIVPGPVSQPGAPLNATLARPYDDLGIPFARVRDLVDLKTSNPTGGGVQSAAALVLRNFPGSPYNGLSAVDEANLLSPDLVSLWIGNNDVLGAATSGVAIEGVTVTPKAAFDAKYAEVVDGIRHSGRTLIFLNIPDVTAIPFATTIPIQRTVGANTIRFLGPRTTATCATAPCPLPDGSLLTLQAQALLGQGIGIPIAAGGTGQPLPDGGFDPGTSTVTPGVILYPDEVALLQARTNDYNATIASTAAANGGILIDVHGILDDIKANGFSVAGINLNSGLLIGGLFSADGVHPSNIAQAIIADEIILTLNRVAGTDYPEPDFSAAFFTPNVPPGAATLRANELWPALLENLPDGLSFALPVEERAAPVLPARPRRAPRAASGRQPGL